MSIFILLTNILLAKHYDETKETEIKEQNNDFQWSALRPLWGLSIVAFIIMFNEGAVEHWSSLFLNEVVQIEENKAGLGFVAFSLCMTIGRFFGDGISQKYGSITIILVGTLVALLGYIGIVSAELLSSISGFGILGLGLSVIIPEIYRLAGNSKQVSASMAISVVTGIGFAGFLIGPVLLGVISDWSSLVSSFGFLAMLVLMAFILSFTRLRKVYK